MHEEGLRPITYRVVVCGRVGKELAEAFGHIDSDPEGEGHSLTVADSSQLYALLDRLQDLGISLVSVNPVD